MNTRIGDTPGVIPGYGTQSIDTTKTEAPVGTGVASANGPAPNPAAPSFGALMQALRNFAPEAGGDFEARLADITSRLREVSGEVETDRVLNEQESKRLNMKENQSKIEESERKLEEAEAKKRSGNIFTLIGLAFQALGAALMIALGALLAAVPGMQGLGALMIAGGVMMALSFVNSVTQQANEGAGIVGSIVKAAGGDAKAVMAADMSFMAATLVATILTAFLTGGASGAAAAPGIAASFASGVKTASTAIQTGLSTANALTNVGAASSNLAAAVDNKAAAQLQAESKDIEGLMQQLDDMIDEAIQMLLAQSQRFNNIADSMTEMLNETSQTLSATRFSG